MNVIKRLRAWKEYKTRVINKKPVCDHKMGVGYYFATRVFGLDPYKQNSCKEMKMVSGKTGYYKLIKYELFSDPDDMIKFSEWQFLGYKNEKLIEDMSFPEFIEFFVKYF